MTLQEKISSDLKTSMKAKTAERTSALRVVLGEFQRQDKKELSDQEVMAVIKKLVKSETETMEKSGVKESAFLTILEEYLPRQAGEDEIRQWISDNIDFGEFKNKMQAMRPIMAHFAGTADGNLVKEILDSL